MRISDWSSDVCSSDLSRRHSPGGRRLRGGSHHDPASRRRKVRPELLQGIGRAARRRRVGGQRAVGGARPRSEEHTSELQSLMRISYAVFCLKKKKTTNDEQHNVILMYTTYYQCKT